MRYIEITEHRKVDNDMKKNIIAILGAALLMSAALTGCASAVDEDNQTAPAQQTETAAPSADAQADEGSFGEASGETLTERFGARGEAYTLHLLDNTTAEAIAAHVGSASWNLPIYSYDESDVMEYYDIPRRYDIPDNSQRVTQAHAGDVFYSDPNRIVLYYADAEIDELYTLIGTFEATPEFVDAVVNNPVLEGWGNQIVAISAGE